MDEAPGADGAARPTDGACRNCDAVLRGPYCSECGQHQRELLTATAFARVLIRDVLDLDGRAVRTLRSLLTRPGELLREYSHGRRIRQLPPGRLYLATAALFFFLSSRLGDGSIQFDGGADGPSYLTVGPLSWDSELLLLVLIPVWAGLVHATLARTGTRFEQSFVFSVHYHVFFFFVMLLLAAVLALWEALALPSVAIWTTFLGLGAPLPYLIRSLRRGLSLSTGRARVTGVVLFLGHLLIGQMLFLGMGLVG